MQKQSTTKGYNCLSKKFLPTSKTGNKNHQKHDPQQINLMLRHWFKLYKLNWIKEHRQSAAKCCFCVSKRFPRKSKRNWKQKSSERHNPAQINLMQEHWLKPCKVKWNETRSQMQMSSLFVREIPTLFTKMEIKITRMTLTMQNQSDAWTLTETMITEVKRNTRTVRCKKSSLFVKKNLTNITKLETKIIRKTQYAKIILTQRHWKKHWKLTWNKIDGESAAKHWHCLSEIKRFLCTSRHKNQKSQRMTQSTQNQSDARHRLKGC